MANDGFLVRDASAPAAAEGNEDTLAQVLAIISEVVVQTDRLQGVVQAAEDLLPKPSRAELEAMREVEQAVPPEAFLLSRLDVAFRYLENAWSLLESIDTGTFDQLADAFAAGDFPMGLVDFYALARAAGHDDLVGREALERALALEEPSALRRAGQAGKGEER
jgi:hypothetical protein